MAQPKLPIKDILAAIDMNGKNVWKELSAEERKSVSFWLLNRYVSAVQGNRDEQELAVFKTNEYYNKNFNVIGVGKENGHQELMWQLLCMSGSWGAIKYHPYIGFKKKAGNNNATLKFLELMFPNMKLHEVELLASISTKKELKTFAEEHGIENVKF
jgi:hypothetical protein|tara:strand:- start:1286 stop:1756 length:471 start_codon:yes stop_codon:yes gene_type:complete